MGVNGQEGLKRSTGMRNFLNRTLVFGATQSGVGSNITNNFNLFGIQYVFRAKWFARNTRQSGCLGMHLFQHSYGLMHSARNYNSRFCKYTYIGKKTLPDISMFIRNRNTNTVRMLLLGYFETQRWLYHLYCLHTDLFPQPIRTWPLLM